MIQKDQPRVFPPNIVTAMSSVNDGNMKYFEKGLAQLEIDQNRKQFFEKKDIEPEQTVLIQTTYDGPDYRRYKVVNEDNKGQGLVEPMPFNSDSLATITKNVAIFLPIADCIGAILYDDEHQALMIAHLGRQHTEQHGATKSVEFMTQQFGTKPEKLTIWLGPAPHKESYPLFAFNNRSLHDVNMEHFTAAGVHRETMTVCPVDTTVDTNYFSHSEFLKGNRQSDGRYAIVAMIRQPLHPYFFAPGQS